jgi:hypothetical protein
MGGHQQADFNLSTHRALASATAAAAADRCCTVWTITQHCCSWPFLTDGSQAVAGVTLLFCSVVLTHSDQPAALLVQDVVSKPAAAQQQQQQSCHACSRAVNSSAAALACWMSHGQRAGCCLLLLGSWHILLVSG